MRYYPYATTLEARLKEAFPGRRFSIQVEGLPGDTILEGQYKKRLRSLLSTAQSPYDFVIIQGGGNDLAYGNGPKKIIEGLKEVWRMVFEAGSNVVALTVTQVVGAGNVIARYYDSLNEMIVSEEHERLYSVDVSKMLPPATIENVKTSKIYDRDGVHLAEKGYELMGGTIASALIKMIRAQVEGEATEVSTDQSPIHHFNATNTGPHEYGASSTPDK